MTRSAGDPLQDWPRPSRLLVVGLDLAWSPRNPTGACVAAWDGKVARLVEPPRADLGGNEEIAEYVRAGVRDEPAVVAIDCPLAVPNRGGLRDCDVLMNRFFRRFEAGVYPANQTSLGRYGGLRGVSLAGTLAADGFSLDPRAWTERRVIEVYPHAAMIGMFGLRRTLKYKPRQGRSYEERWREMAKLQRLLAGLRDATPPFRIEDRILRRVPTGIRGGELKRLEDVLDSLICAYVGLAYGVDGLRRCAVFGDGARGHIVVPTPSWLARRAADVPARDVMFDRSRYI